MVIFRRRECVRQAVDRGGRRGHDLLDVGGLGGFEDVVAADAHHLERFARLGGAGGDAQRGHVDHGVHALASPH